MIPAPCHVVDITPALSLFSFPFIIIIILLLLLYPFFVIMSDGRLVKMEVDYSSTVDEVLPESQELAKVKTHLSIVSLNDVLSPFF